MGKESATTATSALSQAPLWPLFKFIDLRQLKSLLGSSAPSPGTLLGRDPYLDASSKCQKFPQLSVMSSVFSTVQMQIQIQIQKKCLHKHKYKWFSLTPLPSTAKNLFATSCIFSTPNMRPLLREPNADWNFTFSALRDGEILKAKVKSKIFFHSQPDKWTPIFLSLWQLLYLTHLWHDRHWDVEEIKDPAGIPL